MKVRNWLETLDRAKQIKRWVGILLASAAITSMLLSFKFFSFEAYLYDFRMKHGYGPKPSKDIVLIKIDEKTTEDLNEYPPLSLDYHTQLLESLSTYHPKAIGYLVNMNFVNQVHPQLFIDRWGDKFNQLVLEFQQKNIPFLFGTAFDVNGEILPPYPLSSLPHSISLIHRDGNVFSRDQVTRRALLYLYGKPTFHLKLAEMSRLVEPGFRPNGTFKQKTGAEYFFFRYHGNPDPKEKGYQTYSFSDVVRHKLPRKALEDKIILVGTLSENNPSDFSKTPYSSREYTGANLNIHANILDSILNDQGMSIAAPWITWISTFLLCTLIVWAILTLQPLTGLAVTLLSGGAFFFIADQLFHGLGRRNGLWLQLSEPILGLFLSHYLVIPYRLVREFKKRWDVQKKNEMLTQVEELKSNFLSLVTHDLKTPVARIQGLSEVVLRSKNSDISPNDQRSLKAILRSSDELDRFISSILELTKVESKNQQFNFQNKDINQLIESIVERFRPSAQNKQIRIHLKLEPLFPIQMDQNLISKVIGNLIDNAIKYSPERSTITIKNKDLGDHIQISIHDQGPGLNEEEQNKIFDRFYRIKNDQRFKISGTGLGLYLTKYFIEAHQGKIWVKSEIGKGSVFKLTLPVEIENSKRVGLTIEKGKLKKKEKKHV